MNILKSPVKAYNDVRKNNNTEEMLFITAGIKAFNYSCIFSSLAAYESTKTAKSCAVFCKALRRQEIFKLLQDYVCSSLCMYKHVCECVRERWDKERERECQCFASVMHIDAVQWFVWWVRLSTASVNMLVKHKKPAVSVHPCACESHYCICTSPSNWNGSPVIFTLIIFFKNKQ